MIIYWGTSQRNSAKVTLSYVEHLFLSVWRKEKLLHISLPGLVTLSLHSLSHTGIAEGTAGSGGWQKNPSGYPSDILVLLHMELVLVISNTSFEILGSLSWKCFPGEDNSTWKPFFGHCQISLG